MSTNIHEISDSYMEKRLAAAKSAFTTRRVDFSLCTSLRDDVRPQSGDLVLARVVEIGQQTRLQLATGRRAHMFPGDEIIVSYGNRYAPDQFEGTVPKNLAPCHLVAAGGIAAQLHSKHSKMKSPTMIEPVGLLADKQGRVLNLDKFALTTNRRIETRPLTLVVAGTSMNAGKTTTAASLIRGLSSSGMRVGAAKVTGTGAGGDVWLFADSGADPVLDFVDAGFPSTYLIPFAEIERIIMTLTQHLADSGVDIIILEIADGLYHKETARLLASKVLHERVDGLLFAAGDAMGAKTGVDLLQGIDIPLLALSGTVTMSPLAMQEVRSHTRLPILTKKDLSSSTVIDHLSNWFPVQEEERSFTGELISVS